MATYIPGVQDFIPQLEVFTPDYKFLSDVLETRQDRYDTSYKHLNELYGKIVYADLSREDNQEKRNQYANELSPKLQQISGLDLSLQRNVDAAKALFRPFYDDDVIIKDMIYTKKWKGETQKWQQYRDSTVEKQHRRYWGYGVKRLNYEMHDFINASPEEALKMGSPRYVEEPDVYNKAIAALKESGLSLEGTTPLGDWLIKQKNGTLLLKYPSGEDENGNTTYTEPAYDFLVETLRSDPAITEGYWTKAYVKAREFGEEHGEEYGGEDAAKKVWAEGIIKDYGAREKRRLAKTNKEIGTTIGSLDNYNSYIDKTGIIKGSDQDNAYITKLNELAALLQVRAKRKNRVNIQSQPSEDLTDLLNKAYNMVAANEVSKQMRKAAISYSNMDASRTMIPNQPLLQRKAQEFQAMMAVKKQQWKEENEEQRLINEMLLLDHKAWIEGGALSGRGGEPVIKEGGAGTVFSILDKKAGKNVADIDRSNDDAAVTYDRDTDGHKVGAIMKWAELQGRETVEIDGENISFHVAKKRLMNNSEELNKVYNNLEKIVKNAKKDYPDVVENKEYPTLLGQMYKVGERIKTLKDGIDLVNESAAAMTEEYALTEHGEDYEIKTSVRGTPKVVTNSFYDYFLNKSPSDLSYKDQERLKTPQGSSIMVEWAEERFKELDKKISRTLAEDKEYELFKELNKPKILTQDEYAKRYTTWANKVHLAYIGDYRPGKDEWSESTFGFRKGWSSVFNATENQEARYTTEVNLPLHLLNQLKKEKGYLSINKEYEMPVFDREKAMEDAIEEFAHQKEERNRYAKVGLGEDMEGSNVFSLQSYLRGEEQQGIGTSTVNIYSHYYDHQEKTQSAVDFLNLIEDAVNSPAQNRIIRLGDETHEKEGEVSETVAVDLINEILNNTKKYYGKGKGWPAMNMSFSEYIGGEKGEGKYGGYLIQVDKDYKEALIEAMYTSVGENKKFALSDAGLKDWDGKITIFIPRDYDVNPYSSKNITESFVKATVRSEGNSTFEVPDGGGYAFYFDQDENLMLKTWSFAYNDNPKGKDFDGYTRVETDPYRLLPEEAARVDGLAYELQLEWGKQATRNVSKKEKTHTEYPDLLIDKRINPVFKQAEGRNMYGLYGDFGAQSPFIDVNQEWSSSNANVTPKSGNTDTYNWAIPKQ